MTSPVWEGVRFDGRRLLQVLPDGTEAPFRDAEAERRAWADYARDAQQRLLRAAGREGVPDVDCLAFDPNPTLYRAAVERRLDPSRDCFSHGDLVETYLKVDFFLGWVSVVDAHRRVEGLDVYVSGCGQAGTVLAYHAFGAASVTGTEIDEGGVALARERTGRLPGVEIVRIDPARPLPFDDGAFDLVESLDVVEHVDDLAAYARELGRVLAPGGTAIIAAPNRMFGVEQHTGVRYVPWLPLGVADRLTALGARSPWADADRRQRRRSVAEVRTGNISWRTICRVAEWMGATPHRLHRTDHPGWPMNPDPAWAEWLARQPVVSTLAPTRQVVGLLVKD